MDIINAIKSRRSSRFYTNQKISSAHLNTILESAIWAPSGKNSQPWKFKIITNFNEINQISKLLSVSTWTKTAPCLLIVFLDKQHCYNHLKDIQSAGAVMQNILLIANSLGIDSCWVGEIVESEQALQKIIGTTENHLELMGLITLGYARKKEDSHNRRDWNTFII